VAPVTHPAPAVTIPAVLRSPWYCTLLVASCLPLLAASCASSPRKGSQESLARYEYKRPALGTEVRVVIYARERALANASVAAAFERLAAIDAAVNSDDSQSELSRLNASAGGPPVPVGDDLFAVLQHAQRLARESGGAFDVTAGAYADLWRVAAAAGRAPNDSELEAVRDTVGYSLLRVDAIERTAHLTRPGMKLDARGIARGYAADAVTDVLWHRGVQRCMVEAGEVVTFADPPPGKRGWRIPLRHRTLPPRKVVTLRNGALCHGTGDGRITIIDPFTGKPPAGRPAVTVVARTGAVAQGLATAAAVQGRAEGEQLVRKVPDATPLFATPAR